MDVLREAVDLHMDGSDFLPKRSEITRQVGVVLERRESTRQADSAHRHLDEMEDWKRTWMRERAEEQAAKRDAVPAATESVEVGP